MLNILKGPKNIVLLISILLNVVLYFGWINIGQYRKGVDQIMDKSKEMINSSSILSGATLTGTINGISETLSTNEISIALKDKIKQVFKMEVNKFIEKTKGKSLSKIVEVMDKKGFSEKEIEEFILKR